MIDTMVIPTKPFFVAENEALKKKVEQLEKEADWLASILGKQDCPKNPTHCENLRSEQKRTYAECMKCWREVAQMVVKDASNNS